MAKRVLLFSITRKDCDWQYLRGRGPGGQKKNKTNSAVRCTHRASGAMGYAEDTRSQAANRGLAFTRMASAEKFRAWHRLEVCRRSGVERAIIERVDMMMQEIKVEYYDPAERQRRGI